jgi:hypothetical protein
VELVEKRMNPNNTPDWLKIERWLGDNSDVDPMRWFTAADAARELNIEEDSVEEELKDHFDGNSLERRLGENGFEYRNFQHDFSKKPFFHNAEIKIHVEAPQDELHAAVSRLFFLLREAEWKWESTEPHDYNDYDKQYTSVDMIFVRRYK